MINTGQRFRSQSYFPVIWSARVTDRQSPPIKEARLIWWPVDLYLFTQHAWVTIPWNTILTKQSGPRACHLVCASRASSLIYLTGFNCRDPIIELGHEIPNLASLLCSIWYKFKILILWNKRSYWLPRWIQAQCSRQSHVVYQILLTNM